MLFLCLLFPSWSGAVEDFNLLFSRTIIQYEQTLDEYIHAMTQGKWTLAYDMAIVLTQQSETVLEMAKTQKNLTWEYYASNLLHHCQELQESTTDHNSVSSVYLTAILISHIGQIQSANPRWLRVHLLRQLHKAEEGFRQKSAKQVRNAAEIIHTGAGKMVSSATLSRDVYLHTRWVGTITDLNRLGDALLGEVNENNWSEGEEKLQRIRFLIEQWASSFRSKEK